MGLTDAVAAQVMGELHTLTSQIDDQKRQVVGSATVIKNAAELLLKNSDAAVKNVKEMTYQTQLACAAEFEVRLAASVAKTLTDVAGAVATKAAMQWVVAGVVVAGVLTVGGVWVGYRLGKDAGSSMGYAEAREEVAAAAWGNTPQGAQAYRLAQTGELDKLTKCKGKGWKIEKDVCFPFAVKDEGTYGWRLP